MSMREPTNEEIDTHAEVEVDGRRGYAAWYPQMGGYVGKCVIVPNEGEGCVEVYVWHDGDFPFSEDHYGVPENPRELHHCDPEQFIGFGQLCAQIAAGEVPTREVPRRINLGDLIREAGEGAGKGE